MTEVAWRLREADLMPWELPDLECYMLWIFFESYVNGAMIQWDRVQSDRAESFASFERSREEWPTPPDRTPHRRLFLDVHFMLVCADKVQALVIRLAKKHPGAEIAALCERHKAEFKAWNDFRNHLEHIDDRIDKFGDLGNLNDWTYTFAGEKLDLVVVAKAVPEVYESALAAIKAAVPDGGFSAS